MSYQIYTTKALVCGNFHHNTADKTILLFTRELGMIFALARSVREERSKQRYALQDFSLINVSLIKGKAGWRIGSVETEKNYYSESCSRLARGSITTLFKVLRRFIQGEEAAPKLFDFCLESGAYLVADISDRKDAELLIQLKILSDLGYVDKKNQIAVEGIKKLLKNNTFNQEKLSRVIDKAISSSQL